MVKKRGRGRPKMKRGEQRDTLISFRVNPAEKRVVEAAAKAAKLSRATWVRSVVVAAAGEP